MVWFGSYGLRSNRISPRSSWAVMLLSMACIAQPCLSKEFKGTAKTSIAPTRVAVRPDRILIKLEQRDIASLASNPFDNLFQSDRPHLLAAIDHSLYYIGTPSATKRYPVAGISRDRVERSLLRFRQLVQNAPTAQDLHQAVWREFDLYKSTGRDQKGTVQFTGYYEAIYPASPTRTDKFKYPLYRLPPDFNRWSRPHPTRMQLEGSQRLKGLELAWLSDRFQAFLVQVQGSARLQLSDKTVMTVGYAGKTDRPYKSIGAELVKDGKMRLEDVTLQSLIAYFQKHPQELVGYLNRNESFVFFQETQGRQATGSLGVPVTAERSIATDKSLMPPGGLALIRTTLPIPNPATGQFTYQSVSRFVLDQDTGGAIRGPGRVDIFMGTGDLATARAGLIKHDGELYYLVLK